MKIFPAGGSRPKVDAPFSKGLIVLYENNSVPILGAILNEGRAKFEVLNQKGGKLELPPERLYSLGVSVPKDKSADKDCAAYLDQVFTQAQAAAAEMTLEDIWAAMQGEVGETSTKQICELYFGKLDAVSHLATRLSLLEDKTYFKRKKEVLSPREPEVVEELKRAKAAEELKLQAEKQTLTEFQERLRNPQAKLSPAVQKNIRMLEDFIVASLDGAQAKEAREFLSFCIDGLGLDLPGGAESKAFNLLERIGHFDRNTNLAFVRHRPPESFSAAAIQEAAAITLPSSLSAWPDRDKREDLSAIYTFTIDDESTADMDDAISLQESANGYRLGIHISDVAALLEPGTVLDLEARARATSLYPPERTIHMLPDALASDKASLVLGKPRPAMSYIFELDRSYQVLSSRITLSLIEIKRRFNYDEIDRILETDSTHDQDRHILQVVYEIAMHREAERIANGAIKMAKREVIVAVDRDGNFKLTEIDEDSPARSAVGELMIMANALSAEFAMQHNIPFLYRGQQDSEEASSQNSYNQNNDSRSESSSDAQAQQQQAQSENRTRLKRSTVSLTPESHSSLALRVYAQVTSPIRRYTDLCNQRQLSSFLRSGKPCYEARDLEAINMELYEPLQMARVFSREARRFWLLKYLRQRNQTKPTIGATVMRTDLRFPLVELDEMYLVCFANLKSGHKPGDRVELVAKEVNPRFDVLKLFEVGMTEGR